jgi:protoheme IX farnesyltransferase
MNSYPSLTDLLGLCKLKVVSLILLTAIVGMLLAVPYLPNLFIVCASVYRHFISSNVRCSF